MKENFAEFAKKESVTINGGIVPPTVPVLLLRAGGLLGGAGTRYLLGKVLTLKK